MQSLLKEHYKFLNHGKRSKICIASRPELFLGKGVLKICSNFTGKHQYQSMISIKNHTLGWVFSCKFAAYFQRTILQELLWRATSEHLRWRSGKNKGQLLERIWCRDESLVWSLRYFVKSVFLQFLLFRIWRIFKDSKF